MSDQGGKKKDPKKPSAIIDLKATEVAGGKGGASRSDSGSVPASGQPSGSQKFEPKGPTVNVAAGAAGAPSATARALKASQARTAQKSAPAGEPAPARYAATPAGRGGKSDAQAARSATTSAATAAAAGASASATKPVSKSEPKSSNSQSSRSQTSDGGDGGRDAPPRRRGSGGGGGIWSTLTHMIAALIGGGAVLYGGDQIATVAEQNGFPAPPRVTAEIPPELTQRLAALEKTATQATQVPAIDGELGERIEELEAETARLTELSQSIADLKSAQNEIKQSVAAVNRTETTATAAVPDDVLSRIENLEQTIDSVAKAAGDEGTDGGQIAQITALSGKLADLQSTLKTQIETARASILSDVESRLAPTAEATEAARSGTERLDRGLSETQQEIARLTQSLEGLKATSERLDTGLRATREETGKLSSAVEEVKGDLRQQIANVAKPDDVTAAIAPVKDKLTGLETDIQGVMASEADRKANAQRVVLALELGGLRRALDSGEAFAAQLGAVQKIAGDRVDLSALEPYKDDGVRTLTTLRETFRSLSHGLLTATDATAAGGENNWMGRMLSGAKSIVKVRRTGEDVQRDPDSVEAVVAEIETKLGSGDLAGVIAAAQRLPEPSRQAAADWLGHVEARLAVDKAISKVEQQLKTALTSAEPDDKS